LPEQVVAVGNAKSKEKCEIAIAQLLKSPPDIAPKQKKAYASAVSFFVTIARSAELKDELISGLEGLICGPQKPMPDTDPSGSDKDTEYDAGTESCSEDYGSDEEDDTW